MSVPRVGMRAGSETREWQQGASFHPLPVPNGRRQAMFFARIYMAGLATLVATAIVFGEFGLVQSVSLCTLVLAGYPMWDFLKRRTRPSALLPVIALVHGWYYAAKAFPPFLWWLEEFWPVYLPPDYALEEAALLALVGAVALDIAYVVVPVREYPAADDPRIECGLSPRVGAVLGVVGLVSLSARESLLVPEQFAQILVFASDLSLAAVCLLTLDGLRRGWRTFPTLLLIAIVTLYVLMAIAPGRALPAVRLAMAFFLVYLGVRREMPWKILIVGTLLVFPLMAFKHEYRAREWKGEQRVDFHGPLDVVLKGVDLATLAADCVVNSDVDGLMYAIRRVVVRVDAFLLFAHALDVTERRQQWLEGETYQDVLWKFVPRVVYPNKPNPTWGNEFGRFYGFLGENDYETHVSLPILVETFINFGIPGVCFGMLLISVLYGLIEHVLSRWRLGDWSIVAGAVVGSGLAEIENNFLLMFGSVGYSLLLLWGIGMLAARFDRIRSASSVDEWVRASLRRETS